MNGRQEVGFKEIPDGVGKEAKGILMRLSGEVPFDVSYSTLKMEEGDDKVFIQEVCGGKGKEKILRRCTRFPKYISFSFIFCCCCDYFFNKRWIFLYPVGEI